MPVFFECRRCTACCRWPGQVRVTGEEITQMAGYLGISEHAFIQKFTMIDSNRRGLALGESPGGGCVFLEGQDCRVQPVKPQQCRDFPNVWNFPGFEKVCRAIPKVLAEAEYSKRLREATRKEIPGVNPG